MNQKKPLLTIFTPTYNRAKWLKNLHDSLMKQTDMRFEWIIVDDGSTDNTIDLGRLWADEPISIKFLHQNNAGKHVAYNRAVLEASTNLFMCVDSDDWLEANAVETILHDSLSLKIDEGLLYPRSYKKSDAVNPWFPDNVRSIELRDMRMKYGLTIETAIVFKTKVLRRHPFPVFEGENFLPEDAAYYDLKGSERFVLCKDTFYQSDYLENGLTKNLWKNWLENPKGVRLMLVKRYKASLSTDGFRGIREQVAAIVGIESLNIALGEYFTREVPSITSEKYLFGLLSLFVYFKRYRRLVRGKRAITDR